MDTIGRQSILGAVNDNIGPLGPEYNNNASAPPPLALFHQKTGMDENSELRKKIYKGLLIAAGVIFVILLIIYGPKQVFRGLAWVTNQSRGRSVIAVGAFLVLLLVFWSVFCVPFISIIETLSGFILGFWPAMVVNAIGLFLGCVLSFIIGKRYLRGALKDWISVNAPKWAATFKVMEREGITFLIMFRFLALPFWAKNYAPSALLDIPVSRFAISVAVATCPFGALYAYLGDRSQKLADSASSDTPTSQSDSTANVIELVVVLLIVIASIFVSMKAFRMFQKAEAESNTIELSPPTRGQHVLLEDDSSPSNGASRLPQV